MLTWKASPGVPWASLKLVSLIMARAFPWGARRAQRATHLVPLARLRRCQQMLAHLAPRTRAHPVLQPLTQERLGLRQPR